MATAHIDLAVDFDAARRRLEAIGQLVDRAAQVAAVRAFDEPVVVRVGRRTVATRARFTPHEPAGPAVRVDFDDGSTGWIVFDTPTPPARSP